MATYIKTDLEFILQQILIAEKHATGANLRDLLPNTEVAFGLRTVDGTFNNLVLGQFDFGAADFFFPRLLTPAFRNEGDDSFDINGPAPGGLLTNNNYAVSGNVVDADPRIISNLIVDQTANNPAAYATAFDAGVDGILGTADDVLKDGVEIVTGTRADGTTFQTFFFPNVAPDAGLSAPFNQWMTFFGQFFDHGLDLVNKGGNGTVFIPLQADDPLVLGADGIAGTADDLPAGQRFMVLTRATNDPGPDGVLGTADDIHEHTNQTSPFVDQNQTYSSHPSHQVFLRAYEFNAAGQPVSTGKLIVNRDLGPDGQYGTADDVVLGGMATWAVVKAQARDMLGINLTDADVLDVPLLATDPYGMFLRGPNGFPMVMMKGADGIGGTADDFLVEGNPAANGGLGISLVDAVRTGHPFLADIAHTASPVNGQTGAPLAADADLVAGGPVAAGEYDNELLDAHYIAGDGRVNENIGLTAVHHIFHSEHNRLVEVTKDVILQSGDVAFLNEWLLTPVAAIPADPSTLVWNGERLFQAAKFGTEMQYQHLVFEEFARTIQPQVDAFIDFQDTVNPAIVAEFAHTVYRFGHSMLLETIDRLDPNFASSEIGLIQAFLNPLEFAASGLTPEQAAGAIVRGVTRQVGNEIDEFVTEALRNNLLGLPLDLASINIARGRDTGIPSLNAARTTFFDATGDNQLRPYTSWVDFAQHLKHEESIVNFIAAYGTHASITGATTLADKRAAAMAIVLGGVGAPADALDFLHGTGIWAGVETGLNTVDFWIGGLAEEQMPFGGMLGSTFNFVFETQLEALQNGDRLYYLHRLVGTNFVNELENNSFAKLVMLNTDATHLPSLMFLTPGFTLEVDQTKQFNDSVIAGPDGILVDDPLTVANEAADNLPGNADPFGGTALIPEVIRDNPATVGPDTNYLQYTGVEHVVLGGTAGNDILISSEGDDTLYGDGGNDRLEGGYGNDQIEGGDGDDIISDIGGDDVVHGDAGNDVIHGGNGINLLIGGPGNDFIITGEDSSDVIAGTGDDFILGSRLNVQMAGNEGHDWIEIGTQDGAPGDNFDPFGRDPIVGNDVFVGGGGFDEFIGEGGDDIMVGSEGPDKMKGMSGFDWATYKNERTGVTADFFKNANVEALVPAATAAIEGRFASVEGLSGSAFADILRGDNASALTIPLSGFTGSVLTQLDLIEGLRAFLGTAAAGLDGVTGTLDDQFSSGNIILGGAGSDILEGRGGSDILDGDRWLNVRISVRANTDGTGAEIRSVNSLTELVPDMVAGTINPGQLVIVREILTAAGSEFDTAVFSDILANYTVTTDAAGVTTVTHNLAVGGDGIDRLTNIERLQFADQSLTLAGANSDPVGLVAILDTANVPDNTPVSGQVLHASIAGVTDADNPGGTITGPVSYIWQYEPIPGSGIFQDISLILAPRGAPNAIGLSFTVTPDLEGFALRVKAHYQDANGVLETVFSAPTAAVAPGAAPPAPSLIDPQTTVESAGVHYIASDLQFILDQIVISERHAAGENLTDLLPTKMRALGLRTVDGSFNNLVQTQSEFGASDNVFPRLTDPVFRTADAGTSYLQTSGTVIDSQPRTISNLIVDMTANNPAAVAAAAQNPGSSIVDATRADGTPFQTFFIPNVAPDAGLTAPFNAWMTFFGQFFDHGLDLVNKGGNGIVFMPLNPDDPLFVPGSPTNFMVLTRATMQPGPDGLLGTADDIHENVNQTSPFVDQNQTYASHPSHQVFLRAYEFNAAGDPVATGKLIVNRDLGADGIYGSADDVIIGGMATWAVVKAQARDILGINLTDADVFDVPLLATDPYGNFIKGPNGFPQVVMKGLDGIAGTADDFLLEGNPAAPISLVDAVRTGHQFLNDIAHAANPVDGQTGAPLLADSDTVIGLSEPGTYDNELLDAHYIAGDGRVNENIGLTTVHHIFHSEHNRLVEHTKAVVLATAASGDLSFLNQWLLTPVLAVPADPSTLVWNGERLFQAAKFGTEMQYQHLVFEEFARTLQPQIDIFIGPTENYDTAINPAIVAEFAHTVYRFGHSMLTETINRLDLDAAVGTDPTNEIGLIQAFLNPLAFAASGPTPEAAAGAIVQGLTRQVGNEIDEFVTEALRNNLVGLPLDLASINLARGRDTGIPSLNVARQQFYDMTGDSQLKPYTSWGDFVQHIKHPESLVNFIAAYGTHASITAATTLADKRAAASLIVFGDVTAPGPDGIAGTADDVVVTAAPADRLDFLMGTGTWAGVETGLNNVDLWIGGLAEKIMPFGGMLGSTFNFVFETQLEALQNGDRFYYLERTSGLNFINELENNSFAKMVMNNTDAIHLPALIFQTNLILEVDPTKQFNESVIAGPDGIVLDNPLTAVDESADNLPAGADPVGGSILVPLVIRDNPATPGLDTNYLEYTGPDHVVLGGTAGIDIMIASEGDDSLWGDGGNDRLEGGYGNDQIRGGTGDDIITDLGGDDNLQGDDGNDVLQGGNGINLILGGHGKDFIITGEDASEAFGNPGDDFILGSDANEQDSGNEGDDWLEQGNLDGSPGDNFDPLARDLVAGNDIFLGSASPDIMNGQGGDDIMVGSGSGTNLNGDKFLGASGFDWATFKDDTFGVGVDLTVRALDVAPGPVAAGIAARFSAIEGLSGSAFSDLLRGDNADAVLIPTAGAKGSVLTNFDLISGLRTLVGNAAAGLDGIVGTADDQFGAGNIILGGNGSDMIEGRGGDDIIDGDKWLNVRISVRQNADGTGAEIATFDSMVPLVPFMINGTYNPGQLVAVREILPGDGAFNFDTAVFSDLRANYDIEGAGLGGPAADLNGDGYITVRHLTADPLVNGIDGVDLLAGIERLQFNDQAVVLAPGLNAEPVGLLTVNDPTPEVGSLLTVSAAGVTDADNTATGGAIPGPFTFFWQFETAPGSGVFQDIVVRTGLGVETVTGTSFTVPASFDDGLPAGGTAIRVRAVYQDQNGVLETVFSAPTAPVSAVAVNDPPAGTDATVTTLEDTAFVFTAATFGFTDIDVGDSLSAVRIDTLPLAGSLTLSGAAVAAGDVIPVADINAGNLAFTPALNANGLAIASFTFSVADQAGAFDPIPNTLTVNVTAVNDAPVAVADTLAAVEDTVAVFVAADLLANDTDAEGDALTIVSVTSGVGGTAELNLDGTITFTPNANFSGPATFTYTVSDGLATSAPATVTVNVAPVNDAPVPVADVLAAINEDTPVVIAAAALLANDIDVDGDVLSIDSVTSGLGGTATLNLDGTVTFSPNLNFNGAADFAYTVFDGTVSSAPVSALVSVGVSPVNDPPAGTSATITAAEDTPRILTAVDFGFTDVDVGDSLSAVRIDSLPLAGVLTLSGASILAGALVTATDLAAGNLAFTPAANANGPGYASFDFSVADQGLAFALVPSTLTIDVAPVNDAPVILTPLVIDDLTPTEGQVLNATPATLTDADGLTGAVFSYQWQSSANGAAFANIAGATALSFTPTQAQVGAVLRLIQSYIDDEGTLEQVISAITAVVGDLFVGTAAANVFTGTLGDDVISGLAGNDRLFGLAGNDLLDGGTGNDLLDGGLGVDNMIGGLGNDTFVVDDAGDVVSELAGGGTDTVQTTLASYTLGDTLENLTYTGAGNFSGIGNALVNTIRGGSGNDTLDGDLGNDLLIGGVGDDTYLVNNRFDSVVETGGGGVDTILSTAGVYVLGANVENLTYVGTADASLIGNGLANSITGGIGNDALRGGRGNDVLDGGAGNDTLFGEIGADLLLGGLGNDVLRGGDGGGGDTLDGGDGNDSLFGDRGDDVLTGGAGDDILNGGLANDVFVFGAGFGHDRINGFDANATGGQDLLDIGALGVTAASFGTDVSIAVGQFIAGGALDTQVTIGTDTIVLDGVNGVGANAISQADFMLA